MKTTLKDYQSALAKSKLMMTILSILTVMFILFVAMAWIECNMLDFIGDTMLACISGLSTYFCFGVYYGVAEHSCFSVHISIIVHPAVTLL